MMSRSAKVVLLLEVAVCFLPVVCLLFLGLLMVPFQIGFLVMGELSALILIFVVAIGIGGLVALFNVVAWVIVRSPPSLRARTALLLMSLGASPLLLTVVAGETILWQVLAALPLLCSVHLIYLAREYLFGSPVLRTE